MMNNKIPYFKTSDVHDMKSNFNDTIYRAFKNEYIDEIYREDWKKKTLYSEATYEYIPLVQESTPRARVQNIIQLYKSLNNLTVEQAEDERMWAALALGPYLEYTQWWWKETRQNDSSKGLLNKIFFGESRRRSLQLHALAHLWWLHHYLYDANHEDPYHFLRIFTLVPYSGNAVVWGASNFVTNPKIALGIFEAIERIHKEYNVQLNREVYTQANKCVNAYGAIVMIDYLEREEIANLVYGQLRNHVNKWLGRVEIHFD